jgi:hypothetical protein
METRGCRYVRSEVTVKRQRFFLSSALVILIALVTLGFGQRRMPLGSVCGDPMGRCPSRENFQPYELQFETGKNIVVAESKPFYAIVLKSIKLNSDQGNCSTAVPESDLTKAQSVFPHNMVFVMRCWESGQNWYSNVADGVSFMAVYAGQTLVQANAFAKTVKATDRFDRAVARRMRVRLNGT